MTAPLELPPLVLPDKPAAEPAATYSERVLNWWRECDVILRVRSVEQQDRCYELKASMPTQLAPTAEAILEAWNGMDAALLALAGALRESPMLRELGAASMMGAAMQADPSDAINTATRWVMQLKTSVGAAFPPPG